MRPAPVAPVAGCIPTIDLRRCDATLPWVLGGGGGGGGAARCPAGDSVRFWQLGALDFGVDFGVGVDHHGRHVA
jgi:hypothetical protein